MRRFDSIPAVVVLFLIMVGCTHSLSTTQLHEIKETVIQGQKDAVQEINRPPVLSPVSEGGRYVWRPPIIEQVTMPPIIVDGVYIQGRKTPVVLRTGFFELIYDQKPEEPRPKEEAPK
jgi:hypothetical protein